jgi:hypothetical protein
MSLEDLIAVTLARAQWRSILSALEGATIRRKQEFPPIEERIRTALRESLKHDIKAALAYVAQELREPNAR